ncbi:hypothetical protein WA1_18650 [Scytonema hofmannii PCC 7110]|uniref:Uncharacterized protein n=1 Tax=Scytonema hofmannii PCC 7110 TaxID=128403 RepID=A0A139XBG3_9CYAN|nr:hypothetical protein [Scytonema hofmannii]KYC42025.1 hypothetical protein WA1_18650 [Scytonema hofmannii PCC 7110]
MNTSEIDRIPVASLQEHFGIKKTKLYEYLNKCQIQTTRVSGKSYITSSDLDLLDQYHAAVGKSEEEEFLAERFGSQEIERNLTRSANVRELNPIEEETSFAEVREPVQMMQLADGLSNLSPVNRCIAINYLLDFLAKEGVTLDRPALLSLLNKQTMPPSKDGILVWMGYKIERTNRNEWRVCN